MSETLDDLAKLPNDELNRRMRDSMQRYWQELSSPPHDEVRLPFKRTPLKLWCNCTAIEKFLIDMWYAPRMAFSGTYMWMSVRHLFRRFEGGSIAPVQLRRVLDRMVRKGLLQKKTAVEIGRRAITLDGERVCYNISDRLRKALYDQG